MAARTRTPKTPIDRIRVMLSSRNNDLIPDGQGGAVPLHTVREDLQRQLQGDKLLGHQLLEVWINEEAGAESGATDIWETCMGQVDQADILVVIYNGEAGWGMETGETGICHAEMARVWGRSPSKLRVIGLDFPSDPALKLTSPGEAAEKNEANRRFKEDLDTFRLFQARPKDRPSLEKAVKLAVVKAVAELAKTGSEEGRRGRYYLGSPLDWSRLTYPQRKSEMEGVIRRYLARVRKAAGDPDSAEPLQLTLRGEKVLFASHAVPAGFGTPEARELVGRPYLRDHEIPFAGTGGAVGPVHVIACHKTCTEGQISSFMGHPDLFTVQAPFGFFVADLVSFVQTFFLNACRDETSTQVALRRMFDWVEQSGEMGRIVERGRSRRTILETVAKEIQKAEATGLR
ncbi:MAG TPA: hypothetical protein VGX68_22930 [Thermoanaerobaculia bacterium]|jgi:hypothetical protein|nr:hypothetical protein [Thermoanaerobaculia bacterium]